MTLRRKSLLVTCITLLASTVVLVFATSRILMVGFTSFEQKARCIRPCDAELTS